MKTPIDFVITWVDPNDPKWQKERQQYKNTSEEANGSVRYRDWGFLKYLFRAMEVNTPWVNRIFFVTCGHVPSWLNTDHEKLVLVKHSDYIPQEYLPTYNSNVIELFFDRIPGLSEQFVYLNDDMFFFDRLSEEDFFQNGLPVDTFSWNAVSAKQQNSMIEHIILNDMELLERHFDKKAVQKSQMRKLLNLKNGKNVSKTVMLWPWKHFTGIENPHVAQPYLKSNLTFLWKEEEKAMRETAANRFRTSEDLSLWLARYVSLVNGEFVLKSRKRDCYYVIGEENGEFIRNAENKAYRLVCLNDSDEIRNYEKVKKEMTQMMETLFPNRSSFEKEESL